MPNNSHPRASLIVASIACIVAAIAVAVSAYQAWSIRDNAQRQLRAYVGSRIEIRTGPNSEIFLWQENNGQTPARELKSFSSWHFIPAGQPLPADFAFPDKADCPETTKSLGTLFPKTPVRTGNLICAAIVASLDRVKRNELTAVLYGHLEYKDIFDRPGRTEFCWLLTPSASILCDRHNDVR